ncbi:hypothetical protein MJO28_012054 [Puccinia striiformis f. sp. tritici]|nr:hypothetical protein MJO28_012054 [Puccinia striiformis f. sp. tritici]KAI7946057.1 hypothetical protein MJO29_012445 [Puccinia striiformis f. sp. tritici]KAI9623653.1 hypothetical protein H4Q26_014380 [Puccinia striiformis f. sp. tritici PST-130]KNE99514.1 hypothetical protein PSTG_07229 [Puccinia striiformis f. sp. tritici PST-78]POW07630.1 hypothetical protein PSHT_09880 [Puccinia striiformis]
MPDLVCDCCVPGDVACQTFRDFAPHLTYAGKNESDAAVHDWEVDERSALQISDQLKNLGFDSHYSWLED